MLHVLQRDMAASSGDAPPGDCLAVVPSCMDVDVDMGHSPSGPIPPLVDGRKHLVQTAHDGRVFLDKDLAGLSVLVDITTHDRKVLGAEQ